MTYRAKYSRIVYFSIIILFYQQAIADEQPDILYSSIAIPLEVKPPLYPRSAARRGQEGWVLVNFTIEPDGSVSNPEVIDSVGPSAFHGSALKAIKKWEFEPATKEGVPVRTCNKEYVITYQLDGGPGARRSFIKKI